MANRHREFLDLMIKEAKLMEYALDECIRQFDYNSDSQWRDDFKAMMITHAKERLKRESEQH
jgi:hypothetical protein